MAAVSKSGLPALISDSAWSAVASWGSIPYPVEPPRYEYNRIGPFFSSDTIAAGDLCYIASDGTVKRSSGAAANAAAKVDGVAIRAAASGEMLYIYYNLILAYGSGLTPGARYYLSGSTAGGLDTVASTGGTQPVAQAVSATQIFFFQSRY